MLRKMEQRGLVRHQAQDRRYVYEAVATEDEVTRIAGICPPGLAGIAFASPATRRGRGVDAAVLDAGCSEDALYDAVVVCRESATPSADFGRMIGISPE